MTSRPLLPHRRRAWLLGVVVPVLVTAAAWAVVVALLPRVPEPAAIHWGTSGVDRTGSVAELVAPSAVISGVSLVVMALFSVLTGRQALTRRMTLGLAVALATMFGGIAVATVAVQVDAPTASDATSPEWWIVAVVAVALALGAAAGALAGADPAQPADGALPPDAATASLPQGQRAVWLRTVTALGPTLTWVLVVGGAVLAVGLWLLTRSAVPVVVLAPVVVLMLAMTTWQVQVDPRGLTARGNLGWPRVHVPAAEVVRADVGRVRPFPEFGGWGLRTNVAGTVGVVVRAGEAVAVERSGGRRLVVTVDDAATGAALLNTYAERARGAAVTRD